MTRNFSTYFNKNYLIKGVALYRSLEHNCPDFKLWILCMDVETYEILAKLNLKKVTLIKLSELENADPELLTKKNTRTLVEYFWTCSSCLTLYILKQNPYLDMLSYIDADLYFYNSPEEIYQEFGNNSILIIPHRFSKKDKIQWERISGIFNVGLLIFRNNKESLKCLGWWREKCLELCTIDPKAGLCGDQKYLEEFNRRFAGVHSLTHKGAGAATWNIKNYKVSQENGTIFIDKDKLIFFHFASFKIYPQSKYAFFAYGGSSSEFPYSKTSSASRFIYKPYSKELYRALEEIRKVIPDFNNGISERPSIYRQTTQFVVNSLNKTKHFLHHYLAN